MKKLTFVCPTETIEKLKNPERGMYSIYRYTAGDIVPEKSDFSFVCEDDVLLLVEINLCRYTDGGIPEQALSGIRSLFDCLRELSLQLIVRFLYDWEGRNLANEPRKIEIILRAMEQVGGILADNADIIFTVQGLFTGNWGEMHGTRYSRGDQLKMLYRTLCSHTNGSVCICLRTPAQWRCVTGYLGVRGAVPKFDRNEGLPGLFNDGIMGSMSDLGTYDETPDGRRSDMEFQELLCRVVPNGGEAVGDTEYSDQKNAADILAHMHITYLGRDHDTTTLGKWKDAEVQGKGIWDGMSCFDYIERHLGYRFVISDVSMKQSVGKLLRISVGLRNVGFAPLYHEAQADLVFVCGERVHIIPLNGDVRDLCGCSVAEEMVLRHEMKKGEIEPGEYDIYFRLRSRKYDCDILLANEGRSRYGYNIGRYECK